MQSARLGHPGCKHLAEAGYASATVIIEMYSLAIKTYRGP